MKPLTILVTRDLSACKKLTSDLIDFLAVTEGITPEEAAKKVLIVTSDRHHAANVRLLGIVDSQASPVEWITSVSMLTEGWDVQNVFQIVDTGGNARSTASCSSRRSSAVACEFRDANPGERPVVTIFNHSSWFQPDQNTCRRGYRNREHALPGNPVQKDKDYNFVLD